MAQLATPAHIIIVGGGFGGLQTAQALKKAAVRITLIDRNNHHLFQPLLYQVATAGMTAEEIAVPIRSVLRKQKNCQVLLGEVHEVHLSERAVYLSDGTRLTYDYLVLAAGARTNYFGHQDWQAHTVGLKTVEDAFEIRRRVLTAFEKAEREPDAARRRTLLTFVVIGGGPTGVELAGALAELTRVVLSRDFRCVQPDDINVTLLEAAPRLLLPFHKNLSENARTELERLGVRVRLGSGVTYIGPDEVHLGEEHIPCAMTCWTAGVMPQPLSRSIVGLTPTDRGFIPVAEDCSVPGYAEVFAIGDIAAFIPPGQTRPLPGVAPVAMQQARHVGQTLKRLLAGKPRKPFRYRDKGNMATIGKSSAVLEFKSIRLTGLLAWLAWIVVHIFYLIGFRSRSLVMFEWFWAYASNRRGARLITRPQQRDDPNAQVQAAMRGPQGAGVPSSEAKPAWNNNVDPQGGGT